MSTARKAAAGVAAVAVLLSACTGTAPAPAPVSAPPLKTESTQYPSVPAPAVQLYPVQSVYDGDTFRILRPAGSSAAVRVLGIDAPEMAAPPGTPAESSGTSSAAPEDLGRYPECGAVQARDLARSLLLGRSVSLTEDPEQPSPDQYGRTLAYVEVDGQDLAQVLLEAGWVQVFERYPVARTGEYSTLQSAARSAESGGWAMCGWTQ